MSTMYPYDLGSLVFNDPEEYVGIKERKELYQLADVPNGIFPNQISYIRIPRSEISDFRNSLLEFNATCAATGGTYARFMQPIAGLINRLRVMANSTLLDDCLEFGRIYAQKLMSVDNTDWTTSLTITDGVGSTAVRNANATNGNIPYQVDLSFISDILGHVIPIGWLGANQIVIEVYWANANYVIETDGTNPTYVVNNLQFHYANLNVTDSYKQLLNQKFAEGGIQFAFRSYENFITQIQAGSSGTISITLPFKKRRAVAVFATSTPTASLTNTAINDKFITFSNYSIYNSSRYYVNSIYIPQDKIQNTYEQFIQTCDAFDLPLKNSSYIAANWLSGQAFIMGQTLSQSPRYLTEDSKVIQGIDISSGNSNMVAQITFNSAVPALETAFYFLENFKVCTIDGNGVLSVSE